jgi:hypothetical protein
MEKNDERRKLRSSAQRLLHLLVAEATDEQVNSAVKILEHDVKVWRGERV